VASQNVSFLGHTKDGEAALMCGVLKWGQIVIWERLARVDQSAGLVQLVKEPGG